jgi:hypothetical protein
MTTAKARRPDGGAKCGSHRKKGRAPCERPAGWGTAHPGRGRCKLHGGVKKGGDKRVKHGLYSKSLRELLEEKLPEWDAAAAANPDLSNEIRTLRAMLEVAAVKRSKRGGSLKLEAALKVFDRLIKAVDAQHRARRRGMVSLDTVHKYIEAVGLVIAKHVKDPDVLARIEADAAAIPLLAGG